MGQTFHRFRWFTSSSPTYILPGERQRVNASVTSIAFINRVFRFSKKKKEEKYIIFKQIVHYTKTRSVVDEAATQPTHWLIYGNEREIKSKNKNAIEKKTTPHTCSVWKSRNESSLTQERKRDGEVESVSFGIRVAWHNITVYRHAIDTLSFHRRGCFYLFFSRSPSLSHRIYFILVIIIISPYSIKCTNK